MTTRFRSRVEARWAVFLDALFIPYQYEPEGFDLNGVWYLPDFWLPQQDAWIEIKGQQPTDEEKSKALLLMRLTGVSVVIFPNAPWYTTGGYAFVPGVADQFFLYHPCFWSECLSCGFISVSYNNETLCDLCHFRGKKYTPANNCSPRLMAAYNSARQARFEHHLRQ